MRVKGLKLSPDKMEIFLLGGDPDWLPGLNGVTLSLKDQVRNLDVLLGLTLSIEKQISAVVSSALFQFHNQRHM